MSRRLKTCLLKLTKSPSKKLPRPLLETIEKQKALEESFGFTQYPDPKVDAFMKKMNPIRKKQMITKLHPAGLYGMRAKEDFQRKKIHKGHNKETKLIKQAQRITLSPLRLQDELFQRYKGIRYNIYKKDLLENSVTLFVDDISDTASDVNYQNKIQTPILQLDASIQFKTVYSSIYKKVLKHDPILKDLVGKIKAPQVLKPFGQERPTFKTIHIPNNSVNFAANAIEFLQKEKNAYKLFGVYVSLKKSPKISEELVQILQSFNDTSTPSTSTYDNLLKIAKESQSASNATTKRLLTTLGEADLLSVSIKDESITFTKPTSTAQEKNEIWKAD